MTSNQIAFAGNLIEQQKVDETVRHNKEMESLEKQSLENQANQIANDKWYKEESVRLEDTRIALEEKLKYTADLTLRKDIEQRMAENESQRLHMQREYNDKSLELQQWATIISANKVQEEIRANKAREGIQIWSNAINEKSVNLRKYEIDTNAFFNQSRLDYDYFRVSQENQWNLRKYNTDLAAIAQRQRQINLQAEQLEFDKSKWSQEFPLIQSQRGKEWTQTILPFVLPTASSVLGAAVDYLK